MIPPRMLSQRSSKPGFIAALDQSQFDQALALAIDEIYAASTVKQGA